MLVPRDILALFAFKLTASRSLSILPTWSRNFLKASTHLLMKNLDTSFSTRDSVSEGQFKQIMDSEVAAIKAACASYQPNITFVVVRKRHHARFFAIKEKDTDQSGNCMPGTVIDTDIVHPFKFDFYLQSHAGIQGTPRSAHYHVLYDKNDFTSDVLQELTYRFCYIYGRLTSAVSLIPADYYANIVAFRVKYHCLSENWPEPYSTLGSTDLEANISSSAPVKPELKRVMFFI